MLLSSVPTSVLRYDNEAKDEQYNSQAIFLLENGKYLYCRYVGINKEEAYGFIDFEEFDNLEEAETLFETYKA